MRSLERKMSNDYSCQVEGDGRRRTSTDVDALGVNGPLILLSSEFDNNGPAIRMV